VPKLPESDAWLGWFLCGVVLGAAVVSFVVYPPVCGWAVEWTADKVASWLSALGTIAAVVVALGIAIHDGRKRRREAVESSLRRARLLATELINAVATLRVQLVYTRRVLELARSRATSREIIDTAKDARLTIVDAFPSASSLEGLPEELAIPLAQTKVTAQSINSILDVVNEDADAVMSPSALRRILSMDALLDQTHKKLNKVAKAFSAAGVSLEGIDFLDRGDGSHVARS